MGFIRTILIIVYAIVCVTLIALALIQSKDDEGLSGAIAGGGGGSSFYEQNKGRTREGRMKRWTMILGITFAVLTMVLGVVYMV
ncbi:MAG: preprotein translocase subunit SecG [Oscillospiraceae bacterium]|nr:preprotein translocase subunit SecG [Oscillospiraceae bacterium]